MKKIYAGAIIAVTLCGIQTVSAADLEKHIIADDITYSVPSDWEMTENENNIYFYTPDCRDRGRTDTLLSITYTDPLENYSSEDLSNVERWLEGMHSGMGDSFEYEKSTLFELNGMPCELSHGVLTNEDVKYNYDMEIIFAKERIITVTFSTEETYTNSWKPDVMDIFISFNNGLSNEIDVISDGAENEEKQMESEQSGEEQQENVTLGMKNALGSAKSYLSYSGFSREGLADQLDFEGYSAEEISYALDNCGADWNEEAKETAESYLDYSSFSRDGLYDQLEFEGFTAEQIEYALNAVGY